jgi:predicted transcriptional regulator
MKLTPLQTQVLKTIADAKAGEISGLSIARWMNKSRDCSTVSSVALSLVNKGFVSCRAVDYWEGGFVKFSTAMFSLTESGKTVVKELS